MHLQVARPLSRFRENLATKLSLNDVLFLNGFELLFCVLSSKLEINTFAIIFKSQKPLFIFLCEWGKCLQTFDDINYLKLDELGWNRYI